MFKERFDLGFGLNEIEWSKIHSDDIEKILFYGLKV